MLRIKVCFLKCYWFVIFERPFEEISVPIAKGTRTLQLDDRKSPRDLHKEDSRLQSVLWDFLPQSPKVGQKLGFIHKWDENQLEALALGLPPLLRYWPGSESKPMGLLPRKVLYRHPVIRYSVVLQEIDGTQYNCLPQAREFLPSHTPSLRSHLTTAPKQ